MRKEKKLAHEVILDDLEELLLKKNNFGWLIFLSKLDTLTDVLARMLMDDQHTKEAIKRLDSILAKLSQPSVQSGKIKWARTRLK